VGGSEITAKIYGENEVIDGSFWFSWQEESMQLRAVVVRKHVYRW
jgi:hypothetical protein